MTPETDSTTDDEQSWYEKDPFPNPECPCGDPQPDPERLYCQDCIEWLAEDMAREIEEMNQDQEEA